MSTTATTTRSGPRPARVLWAGAGATLVVGGVLTLAAATTADRPAVLGVLVGTGLVLGVFTWGTVVVDAVTRRAPELSLLVGLATYATQVAVMAVVFTVLQQRDLLGSTLDRQWLGGAVVAGVVGWLAVQVPLAARQRIPAYDLSSPGDES